MGAITPLTGIKTAILLIALAFGYIVCYLANREEKDLKILGNVIGIFIIGMGIFLLLDTFVAYNKFLAYSGVHCVKYVK